MARSLLKHCFSQLAVALFLALVVVPVLPSRAKAESVTSFVQHVNLLKNAELEVTESILVDFGNSQRQAIYRVIPIQYQGFGGDYHLDVKILNVTDGNNAPVDYTQNRLGNTLNIRLPRSAQEVTGRQIYRLHYLVSRAVCFFQRAQIYWNATGDAWPMIIRTASITLTLPHQIDMSGVSALGYVGANLTKSGLSKPFSVERQQNSLVFNVSDIEPAQGIALLVTLPKDAVGRPSLSQKLGWFFSDWWPTVLILLFSLAGLLSVWWVCARDAVLPQRISVRFNPPSQLSPCEVGTLLREQCDMHDISSTLVDLAVRGFLKIEETKADGYLSLSNKDYLLTRLQPKGEGTLAPHERLLLDSLFLNLPLGQEQKINLSTLKGRFSDCLPAIKQAVYADLTNKGQFVCPPAEVEKSYYGAGIALALAGIVVSLVLNRSGSLWIAVGNGLVIAGLLVIIFAPLMRARSAFGARSLGQTRALERFMLTAKSPDIQVLAQDKPAIFERLLPYAMVLGISDKWAEAFHGLIKEPPAWYKPYKKEGSNGQFSSEVFVGELGSGMRTVENILAAKPG